MDRDLRRKKRKKKKRILLLIMWSLFLLLMLSTSTYAWFTVNRVVSINSLDIKVNAKGNLQISTDAEAWTNTLTSDDIINARNTYPTSINQLPAYLEPVSSGGLLDENHHLKMFYGVAQIINNNTYYSLNSVRSIETESNGLNSGKFIAFDAFLKIDKDGPLYLTKASGSVLPDGENDVGIGNALRVAFINEGYTSTDSARGVSQSLNNGTDDDVYIWEPNYDIHTANGVNHALNIYNITTTETNSAKIDYDGIIAEFAYTDNISVSRATSTYYPTYFKKVDVDMPTTKDFPNSVLFLNNVVAGIYKIRIYIWVEGQDVDCEDHASTGHVLFNIGFSTLAE
jgi:hypothetical protein